MRSFKSFLSKVLIATLIFVLAPFSIQAANACTSAPDAPGMVITYTNSGAIVKVSASVYGEQATQLSWAMTFFDTTVDEWETWTDWQTVSGQTFSKEVLDSNPDYTFFAFAVTAANSCGESGQVREKADHTGVPIYDPGAAPIRGVTDSGEVIYDPDLFDDDIYSDAPAKAYTGTRVNVYNASWFSTDSGRDAEYSTITPAVCSFSGDVLSFIKVGKCRLSLWVPSDEEYNSASATVTITVISKVTTIKCVFKLNKKKTKSVTGINPKCPTGYVRG